jgi:hypothetical protein
MVFPDGRGVSLLDVLSKISTLFHSFNNSVYFIFNSKWPKSRFGLALLSLFSPSKFVQDNSLGPSPWSEQLLLGCSSQGLVKVNHGRLNVSNITEKHNGFTGFLSAWEFEDFVPTLGTYDPRDSSCLRQKADAYLPETQRPTFHCTPSESVSTVSFASDYVRHGAFR